MHNEKESHKISELLILTEKLRSSLLTWKFLFITLIFLLILGTSLVIKGQNKEGTLPGISKVNGYIAKISVNSIIVSDDHAEKVLSEVVKDKNVKGVIIEINSPGGTLGGSEAMYNSFSKIRKANKPIVAVMKDIAASGAYMIATASDWIFLQRSTITGSIGVIAQSAEFVDLANKLGVKFNTFKSSQLKGVPSPTEKLTPAGSAFLNEMVAESFSLFKNIVIERRGVKLDRQNLDKIFDGKIFLGQTAIKLGLADAIGDGEDALVWMRKRLKNQDIIVVDIELEKKERFKITDLIGQTAGKIFGITSKPMIEQSLPMAILQ